MIEDLIDKQDTWQLVRDRVCDILATETARQQQLAVAAGRDPRDWRFLVFRERVGTIDFLDEPDPDPIVLVRWERTDFGQPGSHELVEWGGATILIEVWGFGSAAEVLDGEAPADDPYALQVFSDAAARRQAHRAMTLARNILAASEYRFLGMRGLVRDRAIRGMQMVNVDEDASLATRVAVGQLRLVVSCKETAPSGKPFIPEQISFTSQFADNGQVIFEMGSEVQE